MSFEPRDINAGFQSGIQPDIQPDMAEATADQTVKSGSEHAAPDAPVKIILAAVFGALALWGGAVAAFGLPGLYIPAVIAVPFLFGMLVLISKG